MNIRNRVILRTIAGAAFAVSALFSGTAHAYISPNSTNVTSTRPLIEQRATAAPLGFQLFCLQNANHCRSSGRGITNYTSVLMQALNRVNRQVNRSIRAQSDRGVDVWSIDVRRGDCEDYVLAKRAALIAMGVPSGALRIATARTRRGIPHAVLVVRTNRGDFILDNLNNSVKQWGQVSHQLIAMSGSNPLRWKTIG